MTKAITKDRRETRLTPQERDEKIERFCLMDDRFMTTVFQDDKECIELILHILIENPELRVTKAQAQYQLENLRGRSVRLDIYATDAAGKRYNIEVQRTDEGASAKRARYNSSLIDANALKEGEPVKNLPETYVIFIKEKTRYYKENEKGRAEMSGVQEELYEEGRAEGREEGREEERRSDILRLLKRNYSIAQIAEIKEMKPEEVEKIAAEA